MSRLTLILLILLLFLTACNFPPQEVVTVVYVTATPTPTAVPTATATPAPTRTPLPTISPVIYQLLQPGQVVRHPPTDNNPYSFYTYFPRSAVRKQAVVLAVWPHGGGMPSEDYSQHELQAERTISWLSTYSERYQIPLVVVAIPRVARLYVHTLHPGTFTTTEEMLRRPDLKLIDAVWGQYIPVLREAGFAVDDKVLMMGFSSPGIFTHRFAMLHPERVMAAWVCGEAAAPIPADEMEGTPLDYPLGVRNLESLTGKPFDLEAYRRIPHFVCVGEHDTREINDPTNPEIFPGWHWQFIASHFGSTNPERVRFFYDYLISIGVPAEFRLYEDTGHEITEEMIVDAFDFLVAHSHAGEFAPTLTPTPGF